MSIPCMSSSIFPKVKENKEKVFYNKKRTADQLKKVFPQSLTFGFVLCYHLPTERKVSGESSLNLQNVILILHIKILDHEGIKW